MSYYAIGGPRVIDAAPSARATFIRRTYGHLAGAILAFIAVEMVLLSLPGIDNIVRRMMSPIAWLVVIGAFMGVSWLADMWARSSMSRGLQYAGLGLYVLAEAVIFLPLLYMATFVVPDPNHTLIPTAGIMTLSLFGGLTVAVLVTGKDFSFLRPILAVGSFLLLGLVIAACFVGGLNFSLVIAFLAIALVSASILYQTSNVLYYYHTDQYVAASLGLFASIATLFYYILYILMVTQSRES